MTKNLFKWIYSVLFLTGLIFVIASFAISRNTHSLTLESNPEVIKKTLPESTFALPKEVYNSIGQSKLFFLKLTPYTLRLPDLRNVLIYIGKNDRPDGIADTDLYFSFSGNKAIVSVKPNKPFYIGLDRSHSPPKYFFSPDNAVTPLWMEASAEEADAQIKVKMRNEKGEVNQEPPQFAQFTLPVNPTLKNLTDGWHIGPWKVDRILFIHQKARWYGPDLFLEIHGGDTFNSIKGKQLIEFGEGANRYAVYVGINTTLAWKENRWVITTLEKDSAAYPILVIKKIDEQLMTFDLWDVGGKKKITLNLVKSIEPWEPEEISQEFCCSGAKMRKQFVFEMGSQRMTLRPQDWILLTDGGWIKINSPQEIDSYVERKLTGTLFVFEDIIKIDKRQYLKGSLFSPTRAKMEVVELPLDECKMPNSSINSSEINEDETDSSNSLELPESDEED